MQTVKITNWSGKKKMEKVRKLKYLGQTTHPKTLQKKNLCQDKSSVELFWKKKKKSKDVYSL